MNAVNVEVCENSNTCGIYRVFQKDVTSLSVQEKGDRNNFVALMRYGLKEERWKFFPA